MIVTLTTLFLHPPQLSLTHPNKSLSFILSLCISISQFFFFTNKVF